MTLNKNIIIIILSIACLIMGYFLFVDHKDPVNHSDLIKKLQDSLQKQDAEYVKAIIYYRDKVIASENKIDSLNKIGVTIENHYIPIYEKINSASFPWLTTQFDSVFASNNIR